MKINDFEGLPYRETMEFLGVVDDDACVVKAGRTKDFQVTLVAWQVGKGPIVSEPIMLVEARVTNDVADARLDQFDSGVVRFRARRARGDMQLSLVEYVGKSRSKAFSAYAQGAGRPNDDDMFGALEFRSATKKWRSVRFLESDGIAIGFKADSEASLQKVVDSSKSLWINREKLLDDVRKRVLREEFEDAAEIWEEDYEETLTKKRFLELLPNPQHVTFSLQNGDFFELAIECEDLFADGYVVISGDKSGKITSYSFCS